MESGDLDQTITWVEDDHLEQLHSIGDHIRVDFEGFHLGKHVL